MVHLQDNSEPNSPNVKVLTFKQRKLWKIVTRLTLLSVFFTLCFIFGRSIQWQSFVSDSSKDLDLIQYLCGQPQLNGVNNNILKPNEELEHYKASYLFEENNEYDTVIPDDVWNDLPVKGAYYMVVRNEKLGEARSVIKSMEDRMKNGTRYPWIFLNNQAFTLEFKKYVKKITRAPVFFGRIDLDVWEYPHWIDVPRAEYFMLRQEANLIYKGASLSFHQLLRYQSGFFFHHSLFKNVEYSWRVEPGADYSCQMDEDMFLEMKEKNKTLGFVLTMYEAPNTIPTLWSRVNEFKSLYPEYVLPKEDTIYPWIYDEKSDNYNFCHFWTNFQIADLSFFRSEAYTKYFQYLDKTGNFFYERWSDAPVQTIAAALFLKKEKIHFFNQIGYSHSVATHCPYNETLLSKCSCDVMSNYDLTKNSCTSGILRLINPELLLEMSEFVKKKDITHI